MVHSTRRRAQAANNMNQNNITCLKIAPKKLANFLATRPEPAKPKQRAAAVHLSYSDLTSRGHNWIEASHGIAKIESPIPIYPKSLALQLVNYNENYKSYKFAMTINDMVYNERMIVACHLASALLAHYFPKAEFDIVKPLGETILKDVPLEGTYYYLIMRKHEQLQQRKVGMLVAVVTHPSFVERADRLNLPGRVPALNMDSQYVQRNKELRIGDWKTNGCSIVLLTGRMYPERPSIEFWHYGPEGVVPFNGLWTDEMSDSDLISRYHSFSLESRHDFETIDRMFRAAGGLGT